MQAPIIIISAMTSDRVIGSEDSMPWDIPAEYEQYLAQVSRETMIMGRRSFHIFGRDIPHARKIVVSRSQDQFDGGEAAESLTEALRLARRTPQKIFIGGGASIYREALEVADRMHLSVVHGDYSGDVFFPEFDSNCWKVACRQANPEFDYFEWVRNGQQ